LPEEGSTMAMAVGGDKKGVMVDMNVTPMIDVLLVLIIIFMMITPLTPLGLDALVPQPNPNKKEVNQEVLNRTIVVSIDATRQVKINQDPIDIRMLGSRLEDIFKTRNDRIMFVKGDDSLPFSEVANIIDIAKGAGIDKIGLITQKIEAGQ
jgi:biopolymer transport protein TolR